MNRVREISQIALSVIVNTTLAALWYGTVMRAYLMPHPPDTPLHLYSARRNEPEASGDRFSFIVLDQFQLSEFLVAAVAPFVAMFAWYFTTYVIRKWTES